MSTDVMINILYVYIIFNLAFIMFLYTGMYAHELSHKTIFEKYGCEARIDMTPKNMAFHTYATCPNPSEQMRVLNLALETTYQDYRFDGYLFLILNLLIFMIPTKPIKFEDWYCD